MQALPSSTLIASGLLIAAFVVVVLAAMDLTEVRMKTLAERRARIMEEREQSPIPDRE